MTFRTKADEDVCTNRQDEIDDLYEDIEQLVFYLNLSLVVNIVQAIAGLGTLIYWLV